jgi:hypothetical protein
MASDQEPEPTRAMEPLLAAVSDSVASGYQALEHVIEGLAESLRLQSGAVARRPAPSRGAPRQPSVRVSQGRSAPRPSSPRAPAPPRAVPVGLVQDLAAVFAELLGTAGAFAEEVAQTIAEQAAGTADDTCLPLLTARAAPGGTATTDFTVWNTGAAALKGVALRATDLVSASARSPEDAVSFAPPAISWIGPGKGETIAITIAVPKDALPGTYRGVVIAAPGDACAVLELTITEPAPQPVTDDPPAPPDPGPSPAPAAPCASPAPLAPAASSAPPAAPEPPSAAAEPQ